MRLTVTIQFSDRQTNTDLIDSLNSATIYKIHQFNLTEPITDQVDTLLADGTYRGAMGFINSYGYSSATDVPSNQGWYILAFKYSSQWAVIIAFGQNDNATNYIRRKTSSGWQSWSTL